MEDILEAILGYRSISASKARKLHHLSHTPPEFWTAEERMLSGKARTQWLHEERNRAARGGNQAILNRIWQVGPYWPNSGIMAGGDRARRSFRIGVERMRYRDIERAEEECRTFNVHPRDVYNLPAAALEALHRQGDWTVHEPNQVLNDLARAREVRRASQPWRTVGRPVNLHFPRQELLRNGRFGGLVGAETEEDRYARHGWERLEGPFWGPGGAANLDQDNRPRVFEAGNGLPRQGHGDRPPPFWG